MWGLYFTASLPQWDSAPLGSRDIHEVITTDLAIAPGFKQALKEDDPHFEDHLLQNRSIARAHFQAILLARLLVLDLYLDCLPDEANLANSHYKRIWLLLQVVPALLEPVNLNIGSDANLRDNTNSRDIFAGLAKILSRCTDDDRLSRIAGLFPAILKRLPGDGKAMHCVLDEAQSALCFDTAFRGESNKNVLRPVIGEILRAWQQDGESQFVFIVTGSGFSAKIITDALQSMTHKRLKLSTVTGTGAFDDHHPTSQTKYLEKYLPKTFAQSASGRELIERARYWLSGR